MGFLLPILPGIVILIEILRVVYILYKALLTVKFPGIVTSGMISFVYVAANFQMNSTVAMLWGICETVVITLIGFTRILATL